MTDNDVNNHDGNGVTSNEDDDDVELPSPTGGFLREIPAKFRPVRGFHNERQNHAKDRPSSHDAPENEGHA